MRRCFAVAGFLLCVSALVTSCLAQGTVALHLDGNTIEGTPISYNNHVIRLLGRDGQLWKFSSSEAKGYRQVSMSFRGYSQSRMRGDLMREFGRQFDVSGTGQYLVVHPAGQRDKWAQRFDDLFRSMQHYFRSRGFRISRPTFPLVAVVFHRQTDFLKHAHKTSVGISSNVLGYYSPVSNRIFLFDRGCNNHWDWPENASVVIHEAAHQTAHNIGIHHRFTLTPSWVIEGLGTMFEAPGVWNAREYPKISDRINRERYTAFIRYLKAGRSKSFLANYVSSMNFFRTNPGEAYANAWALSFYLAEKETRKYAKYLSKLTKLKPFGTYDSGQRIKDFTQVFGKDIAMLDAHMVRFIKSLKY